MYNMNPNHNNNFNQEVYDHEINEKDSNEGHDNNLHLNENFNHNFANNKEQQEGQPDIYDKKHEEEKEDSGNEVDMSKDCIIFKLRYENKILENRNLQNIYTINNLSNEIHEYQTKIKYKNFIINNLKLNLNKQNNFIFEYTNKVLMHNNMNCAANEHNLNVVNKQSECINVLLMLIKNENRVINEYNSKLITDTLRKNQNNKNLNIINNRSQEINNKQIELGNNDHLINSLQKLNACISMLPNAKNLVAKKKNYYQ